jgi:hypothetical protein
MHVGGGVDGDGVSLGINHPHQFGAGEEVFAPLERHFASRISLAEDLDGKVGYEIGNRFFGFVPARQFLPADEGNIRSPDEPVHQTQETVRSGEIAKIVLVEIVLQQVGKP